VKPPKIAALRPTFGIGVVIGVVIILVSTVSGSDSMLGMALGGGAGIALGLTGRGLPGRLTPGRGEREEDDG
jgi:uncharacterized membrane protein YjfL (UPF0719 family)